MANHPLSGVYAAIATPVNDAGEPDHARFLNLATHLMDSGADGLNVLGTTGEATSFSVDQRIGLMAAVAESGLPVERFLVGTGAAAVRDAATLTARAGELGFGGALVLPPFYYKGVPEEGVLRYFEGISAASSAIPIYLYNFPALSGVPFTQSLIGLLRDRLGGRIAGLKDSSGDLDYARRVASIGKDFAVFPSSEAALLEARAGIFAGCISATANINSSWCARTYHQGDAAAHELAVAIRGLFDGLPLVPAIKGLLAHIHEDPSLARTAPPFVSVDDSLQGGLAARYDALLDSARSAVA